MTSSAAATRHLLPGLSLALGVAVVAWGVNLLLPTVSALLVAILAGVVVANTISLPKSTAPGLAVASKRVLRLGIVLLGLQVSMQAIAGLGVGMFGVVVAVVVGGLLATEYAGRALHVAPARRRLIGAGFSICGAAAVAATSGLSRDEREEDVVTALALVVLFGTLMIPLVPLLSGALGLDPLAAGLWAGGSIHEVAQVVAAGGIIGGVALEGAVVVKLARVLMLAPVVMWFGWRSRGADTPGTRPPLMPLFVAGFLAAVAVRSTGLLPQSLLTVASLLQTLLLSAAMFALGCGVRFSTLKTVGAAPFALAAISTVTVGGIALAGVLLTAA